MENRLKYDKGEIKIPSVNIKRGIFQGDSLSPLLFILALDPLSRLLNNMNTGYNIYKRNDRRRYLVNHLLYMDDLKLYNSNQKDLKKQIELVYKYSRDIGMEFGLDKCAKINVIRGKHQPAEDLEIDHNKFIKELDRDQQYKYLGMIETNGMNNREMK